MNAPPRPRHLPITGMHLDIVQGADTCPPTLPPLNHLYAPPKPVIQRRQRGAFCCLADAGATKRVTGGKVVQKRTLCQLEPGVCKCQAAWSDLRERRDTSRGVPHFPHFHARQSGSPTVRVFLAVPTKSLPCALARGDNDRDIGSPTRGRVLSRFNPTLLCLAELLEHLVYSSLQ
ncbi:hypothetical protein M422DRAFT_264686 [Sphaerobolus stellatus SS14]|uniref:Uncharacterized protein n=1 Tax=Sphaerobolus stellatus (strain SS14) TaxID=990650 RepID=A0A0C9V806_SPHS4|nr:hypothetical protein M422DRAFT_264686 [Sphaerobolus stellatus SS14]